MHVDRAVEHVVVAVARFIEERLAGFDTPLRFRETREQIKLNRREHERLGAEHGGAGVEIEPEIAHDDFLGRSLGVGGDSGVERTAAEDGAESGEEFACGKRFREVIIRADFEAHDAVGFVAACREHEYGHGRFLADAFQDLEAVHAGEHHIENERVRGGGAGSGGAFDALGAGVHGGDVESEWLKVSGDETAKLFVVVNHQQARAAGVGSGGIHRRGFLGSCRRACNRRELNVSLTILTRSAYIRLTSVPYLLPMRCVFLLFLLCSPLGAAELRMEVQLRWRGVPVAVPSAELAGATGQTVRLTRFAAIVAGVVLTRAEGGTVQLDGQYGLLDAESGRLALTLRNVPDGDYHGLAFQLGLPAVVNHGDPGQWPARHPLNPIVNGLHWGWAGGYVFAAIEGRWRAAASGVSTEHAIDERGFSYHLATDARVMRVGFVALVQVAGPTTVSLALDLGKAVGGHVLAADDGSETTHSGEDDELATTLTKALERAWFFLEAKPTVVADDVRRPAPRSEEIPGLVTSSATSPRPFVVPAGFPQPELPADNPLTQEGVALGERLFHDQRLSAGYLQSCASCHAAPRAFSDGQATSAGVDGIRGTRNSMPLFNLAWSPAYAWDGGKPRIRDQVRAAMTNPIEMKADLTVVVAELNRDAGLRDKFAAAFGSPEITADRVDLAMEQFLLTLVAADSKFDRSLRGAAELTAEEKAGFALFVTEYDPARGRRGADCFHCHGGALFTDFGLRSNGLDLVSADGGRALVTGKKTDAGKFKTPSLRNVAVTAPFMHDGRLATLEDVIAHYDHGVKRAATLDPNLAKHPAVGLALTAGEQRALVAFLRTLTDSTVSAAPAGKSLTSHP